MTGSNSHFIYLGIVVLLQLLFLSLSILLSLKIKNVIAGNLDQYKITEDQNHYYISIQSSSKDALEIESEVNSYLRNHYAVSRIPDTSQIFTMIKERSRIYDGLAAFYSTIPILIGLAGTVLGLFFTFFKFQNNSDASTFLLLISQSSSIAFLGTLSGILCTIICNYNLNYKKKQRDISLNTFFSFININLSPKLPTIKDETVSIVAKSLNSFSEEYFQQFKFYTSEFKEINKQITQLYQNGFKSVIERNTQNLERFNTYIEKLDNLSEVTKGITFKPSMINEFSNSASLLVNSLKSSSLEHQQKVKHLESILTAYQALEERINKGILDLFADHKLFGDYALAIKTFIDTTKNGIEDISLISKQYEEEIKELSKQYSYNIGTLAERLVNQVDANFNTDAYSNFADNIKTIQISVEKESENIKQLSISLAELNNKISTSLIPAFSKTSDSVNNTNNFLRIELPKALQDTIDANKKMVIETSEKLLNQPKSWGSWSFKIVTHLFKKNKRN